MTDTDAPRGSAPAPALSSARSDQRGPVDLSAIPSAARERWSELVRDIEAARDAYYNAIDAESPLSDADYDTLYRELEGLEAAHPLLARDGAPTRSLGGGGATPPDTPPDLSQVGHAAPIRPAAITRPGIRNNANFCESRNSANPGT